jgi:hypothetical protein
VFESDMAALGTTFMRHHFVAVIVARMRLFP